MAAINNLNVNLLINDTNCLSEMCFMISQYGRARLDGLSCGLSRSKSDASSLCGDCFEFKSAYFALHSR